jgi:Tol biopolymer transport system component
VAALRPAAPRIAAIAALAVAAIAAAFSIIGCAGNGADAASRLPGVKLVELAGVGVAAWSPDGRRIAVPVRGGIGLRKPDGAPAGRIDAPPMRIYFGSPNRIQWSPDGRWLRYVTAVGPERGHGIWATQVRRDGTGLSQTPLGTELAFPAWSPDGWPLVFATGPLEWEPDGKRSGPAAALRAVSGPGARPRKLLATAGIPEEPVVSHGQILFKQWRHHRTELWTVGADGSAPRRLGGFVFLRHYERSPNGRLVAFAGLSPDGPGTRLFVVPSAGGKPKVVVDEEVVGGPVWSPDGSWLTFSNAEGEIKRIHPDGSGAETIASFPGEEVHGMLWSPDGRRLLYSTVPFRSEFAD